MDPAGIDGNGNEGKRRDVGADVDVARERLADARSKLDVAVAALPDAGDDETMATPALLSLLLGAVSAKNRLDRLEALLTVPAMTTGGSGVAGRNFG
jgi:hypothetical protein